SGLPGSGPPKKPSFLPRQHRKHVAKKTINWAGDEQVEQLIAAMILRDNEKKRVVYDQAVQGTPGGSKMVHDKANEEFDQQMAAWNILWRRRFIVELEGKQEEGKQGSPVGTLLSLLEHRHHIHLLRQFQCSLCPKNPTFQQMVAIARTTHEVSDEVHLIFNKVKYASDLMNEMDDPILQILDEDVVKSFLVQSILFVPVHVNRNHWALLVLDSQGGHRYWDPLYSVNDDKAYGVTSAKQLVPLINDVASTYGKSHPVEYLKGRRIQVQGDACGWNVV